MCSSKRKKAGIAKPMWLRCTRKRPDLSTITINCSTEAWKRLVTLFLAIAGKYAAISVSCKKMTDGERTMKYKIEDVGDVEAFPDECQQLEGFPADFESL